MAPTDDGASKPDQRLTSISFRGFVVPIPEGLLDDLHSRFLPTHCPEEPFLLGSQVLLGE